ncbi:hypothetical protein BAA08_11430 [Bizionia sp. APA-3]|nr:hypothetical protein BAA08_11430 [Bizionia sp. APA-3]
MNSNMQKEFLMLIRKYSDNDSYNLECWNEIEKAYCSKSRHYHNLNHIKNMLSELEKVSKYVRELDTLLFAIYYHDIIYKATKSDNEHQSALKFQKRISNTTFTNIKECIAQIEATKTHKLATDSDTNILLDIDLSILGKSPETYCAYSNNIRKEYQIYPDLMYNKGRKKVLKNMLDADSIYKTDFFKQAFENQARTNLKRELESL